MRKLYSLLTAALVMLAVGCVDESGYDDSAIWNEFESVHDRIDRLEEMCSKMNSNISALQTLVEAMETGDYITSVAPIMEGGKEIGYTITFAKSGSITIYHGIDGEDGADGKDGANGTDGKDGQDGEDGKDGQDGAPGKDGQDGQDGATPQIGIAQDTDGNYYWTLNGDWLLDSNGNKVKAVGTDGKDGQDGEDGKDGAPGKDGQDGEDGQDGQDGAPGKDGQDGEDGKDGENGQDGAPGKDGQDGTPGKDGKDGVTPRLKIENGMWYVSYDEGTTWEELGVAAGGESSDDNTENPDNTGTDDETTEPETPGNTETPDNTENPGNTETDTPTTTGTCLFTSVTVNEQSVTFTLADGSSFTLPLGTAPASLLGGLQSVTFVPRYSDGMATVTRYEGDGAIVAEFDYEVIPESLAATIAENCESLLTMKAVETATRSLAFVNLPILSCAAEEGVLSIKASGEFLNPTLFEGTIGYSAALQLNDGQKVYKTDYVALNAGVDPKEENPDNSEDPIEPENPENEMIITYVSTKKQKIESDYFLDNIVTNEYDTVANKGTIRLSKPIHTLPVRAFENCTTLKEITLPKKIRQIGDNAFYGCSGLETIVLPDSLVAINSEVFYECKKLKEITIPENVTSIGSYAFYDCEALTHVEIPDKVASIGSYAFAYTEVRTIHLGKGITSIGIDAFDYIYIGHVIYIEAETPPTYTQWPFTTGSYLKGIYVPMDKVSSYKNKWAGYTSHIYGYDFGYYE